MKASPDPDFRDKPAPSVRGRALGYVVAVVLAVVLAAGFAGWLRTSVFDVPTPSSVDYAVAGLVAAWPTLGILVMGENLIEDVIKAIIFALVGVLCLKLSAPSLAAGFFAGATVGPLANLLCKRSGRDLRRPPSGGSRG